MPAKKKLPEHVQIIESLMLRPQKNRAILIPSFLFIGVTSIILGTSITLKAGRDIDLHTFPISTGSWISSWFIAALSVILVTLFTASKQAKEEERTLNSPQLRHVFRCLAPALMLGLVTGISLSFHDVRNLPLTAALWISSYGVALLSIRLYTTKSTRFLGILMLALGLAAFYITLSTGEVIHPLHLANFFMALAFGMFHLIVASGSILFAKANT